ncbi:hemolysin-iii channel protein [Ophiostoma piceae UAMH 11346]|uniref:Hemolysin-iii channel protein n=1 Tax=Ophiostoma piceae (strain UAMH 11346) TaxID=1262450 RepID=S3C5B8_OPHP1|nr:hemolysin-iii channel protein [Ophiostoma piceae UAMH 11346]
MPPKHKPGHGRPKKTAMRDDREKEREKNEAGLVDNGLVDLALPPMTPRKSRQKRVAYALLSWDDLPAWRRDNVYVQTGYRPTSHSYIASFASVAAIHNESVNIWTHLGGAIVATLLGLTLYVESSEIAAYWASLNETLPAVTAWLASVTTTALAATGLDDLVLPLATSTAAGDPSATLVLSCFAGGAVACLGMSATYHALSNHSPAVARWGNKLDYTGIVFLIVGSYVPTLYYGFFCHRWWMTLYLYSIGVLGTACLVVSWLEHFRTPAWRPYRALLFVALGVSGVVPIAHSLFWLESGATLGARYASLNAKIGLGWVLLQGALYVFGAFLYAARWPERQWPGQFDIWGSSHQIFHVFVVAAAAAHLRGVLQAYMHHHQQYHVLGATCPAS